MHLQSDVHEHEFVGPYATCVVCVLGEPVLVYTVIYIYSKAFSTKALSIQEKALVFLRDLV